MKPNALEIESRRRREAVVEDVVSVGGFVAAAEVDALNEQTAPIRR